MGERPEGAGAAGALILSRGSPPARWCGGSAPLFRPGRGNREGAREEVGWAGGAGVLVAAQLGPGGGSVGGGGLLLFFFFSDCFCFLFICLSPFLFYFI